MRMSGLDRFTLTPSRETDSGRRGAARATRFCTFTWFMFGLVPRSKVELSVIEPSAAFTDFMYSMSSTPLTCASMGVATDASTAGAAAPR